MSASPILLRYGADDGNTHHILSRCILSDLKTAIYIPRGHYYVFRFISSRSPLLPRTDWEIFLHSLPSTGKSFPGRGKFFPSLRIPDLGISIYKADCFKSVPQLNSAGSAVDSMPGCPILPLRLNRCDRLPPHRSPSPRRHRHLSGDRKILP